LRQKKNAIDSEWILRFGEIILKGWNWNLQRKTWPRATLCSTNATCPGLRFNPSFRGESQINNRLSHGTATFPAWRTLSCSAGQKFSSCYIKRILWMSSLISFRRHFLLLHVVRPYLFNVNLNTKASTVLILLASERDFLSCFLLLS
jgi:hypothetical protein